MKHFGDITKIDGHKVPLVDIVTGGSPCQDLSVAGNRAGLSGERSGLFMEQIRIIKEMHDECRRTNQPIRPRFMVWENVPGAFSSNNGEDFRAVLEETARIVDSSTSIPRLPDGQNWSNSGAIMGDGWSIAWRVHNAKFWGVPQNRRRISLIADFRGQSAPPILFECKGLSRDSEQVTEEGKGTPTDAEGSSDRAAFTLKIRGGCERDSSGRKAGKGALIQEELSGTLGLAQDQTVICLQGNECDHQVIKSHGKGWKENTAFTLTRSDRHGVCYNPWDVQSKHIQPTDGVAEALYSGECRYGGGESYVLDDRKCYSQDAYDKFSENETASTLKAQGGSYGGGPRCLSETIGALCRADYKGVGNQYVNDGKVVIERVDLDN